MDEFKPLPVSETVLPDVMPRPAQPPTMKRRKLDLKAKLQSSLP